MRHRISLTAGATAIALAGAVGTITAVSPASAAPRSHDARVVGYAYVDGNTVTANTVAGFARHADGSLTPLDGSPFAIGGAGLGVGLGSQGAIQASPNGRFLIAVDAGSNELSVLRVGNRGQLSPVGAPVPSGGVEPVSVAVRDDGLVYVANVGTGGSNYAGFTLSRNGQLTPLDGSTVAVPEGSAVGDVLFNPTGDRLIGTRDNPSLIDSFTVGRDGRLTAAAGSPFAAQDLGPIGAEFRPTRPSQLFVSNAHAGPDLGTVSAFDVSRRGVLTSIGASPYADLQTAPCWIEITRNGKFLFAVNTASATISRFSIDRDGSLVLLGSTPFTNGTGAIDARLTPDGNFLSVTGGRGHVISTFSVNGGDLTEIAGSPVDLPVDGAPAGLVNL